MDEWGAEYRRDSILSDDRVPVSWTIFGIERHSMSKKINANTIWKRE